MTKQDILQSLPYSQPFLFVDELLDIDENGSTGTFTFREDLDFYKGHFKDAPVTPGVILTETMAQIGLVCLGLFLSGEAAVAANADDSEAAQSHVMLTSTAIDFMKPVYPGEKVTVVSEKVYFRFKKLNCNVRMLNEAGDVVCKGNLSGMVTKKMST
jgi:3-hydroxyacyl-[acyl-carrier-protein] dehydratase